MPWIGKRFRVFMSYHASNSAHIGLRLRQGDTIPQASNHANGYAATICAGTQWQSRFQRIRDVKIHGLRDAERRVIELEGRRQNSYNQGCLSIETKRAAYRMWICCQF
jgi:hypothetical protein